MPSAATFAHRARAPPPRPSPPHPQPRSRSRRSRANGCRRARSTRASSRNAPYAYRPTPSDATPAARSGTPLRGTERDDLHDRRREHEVGDGRGHDEQRHAVEAPAHRLRKRVELAARGFTRDLREHRGVDRLREHRVGREEEHERGLVRDDTARDRVADHEHRGHEQPLAGVEEDTPEREPQHGAPRDRRPATAGAGGSPSAGTRPRARRRTRARRRCRPPRAADARCPRARSRDAGRPAPGTPRGTRRSRSCCRSAPPR